MITISWIQAIFSWYNTLTQPEPSLSILFYFTLTFCVLIHMRRLWLSNLGAKVELGNIEDLANFPIWMPNLPSRTLNSYHVSSGTDIVCTYLYKGVAKAQNRSKHINQKWNLLWNVVLHTPTLVYFVNFGKRQPYTCNYKLWSNTTSTKYSINIHCLQVIP